MAELPTIQLQTGETAVVGYGSLLSRESVSKTLKRPYIGPFLFAQIDGRVRTWDVSMPNAAFYYEEDGQRIYPEKILYLNLRQETGAAMNCAVFVVNAEDLRAMHGREWIYDPVVITDDLREIRVVGGDAIVYAGRSEHLVRAVQSPRAAAVRSSYLGLLERALQQVDPLFRAHYERTTDPAPSHLIIDDRLDPERPSPWAAAGHSYTPER